MPPAPHLLIVIHSLSGGGAERVAAGDAESAVRAWVSQWKSAFPSQTLAVDVAFLAEEKTVLFIEFNPVDNELDTFELDLAELKLSEKLRDALAADPQAAEPKRKLSE